MIYDWHEMKGVLLNVDSYRDGRSSHGSAGVDVAGGPGVRGKRRPHTSQRGLSSPISGGGPG